MIQGSTISEETAFRHIRKYESRNVVQNWLLRRFHAEVRLRLVEVGPRSVFDFGCGEAYFWAMQEAYGPLPEIVGLDLRDDAIAAARARLPNQTFIQGDLLDYDAGGRRFDLVVASEILEHLHDPEPYVRRLCGLTKKYLLITVPHEPFFRMANLVRGRDLSRLGNHPEHVQHWNKQTFRKRFANTVKFIDISTSFPFIIFLCEKSVAS